MTGQPYGRGAAYIVQDAVRSLADRAGGHHSDGSTLLPVLRRLEETVLEETEALRNQRADDLPQLFQRKSQGLLELANVQRTLGNVTMSEPVRAALLSFRQSLDANRDMLKLHIDATSELIEVFAQAIRESESDGTYDQGYGRRRAP